ncbi:branched-chain amino acid transport system II carrier protein [Clostridium botulinum]|uniref:Branched-chain amino acid transport system carrier protein n=1 Tax=Clostridium botulinum C/D str. DC5 TaxID=1443128 RepID=A0A0A0IHI0_CLOBO|nr:branched-chain amino acid transport system II carrier protein [Clostridium botulinum]KEI06951.1 branched-chain amino acid transporter [Clostridium botulinum C/D str. BKT75002]KEI08247.1 branched-chain amino acid transporter [Clostridium botulinum C/D str. BKT2873]KGN00443.1 branched-chain amino acid transporter [Clostridium botulinum C/D str. DC5]KOC52778.1 branched-chain amino acid transporter [Clostridium botulinum]KOC58212.1 branched-chain amino acid transporter [Clostridium botulinum]
MNKTDNLSGKNLLLVSLMLFSLFFGAGNLIFPPFLGQAAGSNTWIAMCGFFVTAVGFPILGVIAVAKSGGLHALSKKVHPAFAVVFTVLIYLSIGPCLGIPRAGSLPFEMAVAPFLPEGLISNRLALFSYTFVFFSVAYWLCLTPSKLVNRMGKVLTPTLLTLITCIFLASLFKPLGGYGEATGEYVKSPLVKGFLDGYLTMDTIAALNFGIVISLAVKAKGVKAQKAVINNSIKAGLIAGALLVFIYSMLGHLGATSGGRFGVTENGAQTLANIMQYIFGKPGLVLLAITFTLACLTTCVGLITSCSQYFVTVIPNVKYITFVRGLSLSSMVLANMGLTKILAVSVPVLDAIYPIAIVLILLSMVDSLFRESSVVYISTIAFTSVISILYALSSAGLKLEVLEQLLNKLPLYSQGLGWVVPSAVGFVLGLVLKLVKDRVCGKALAMNNVKE